MNATSPRRFSGLLWLTLALGWTLAILVACSWPGDSLPSSGLFQFDKLAHLGMFAGFGLLWMHALTLPLSKRTGLVFLIGTAYAILTELYQAWLPFERSAEVLDALANVIGLSLALLLYRWLAPRFSA